MFWKQIKVEVKNFLGVHWVNKLLGSSYAAQSFNLTLGSTKKALGCERKSEVCVSVCVGGKAGGMLSFAWEVVMGNITFLLLLPLHERVRKSMNKDVDTITPTSALYHCTMWPSPTSCDCMTNGCIDSRVIALNFHQGDASISSSLSDP